jgi:hypothetical protein
VPIWQANRWLEEYKPSDDAPLLLFFFDAYLARPDLDASVMGPRGHWFGSGGGHVGESGPRIVTLLLEMAQRGVAGAVQRLTACLYGADPRVRMFGALALAAYDRAPAIAQLAIEAQSSDWWHRDRASEFLLRLGDARGIPGRIAALGNELESSRKNACRDLRVYSQQPLPCDIEEDHKRVRQAWFAWWRTHQRTFKVRQREAELDLENASSAPAVDFATPVR